jgi:ABC-type uncharacterized transport system ATPase subunit
MSIQLHKVSKRFGDVAAVNAVSFSVQEGELLGLLVRAAAAKRPCCA